MIIDVLEIDGGMVVIRVKNSELYILPDHVANLKKLKDPQEFIAYFMSQALINRPARQLFKVCLRKDANLWSRIYKAVKNVKMEESSEDSQKQDQEKKDTTTENNDMIGLNKAEFTREKGSKEESTTKKKKSISYKESVKLDADDDSDDIDTDEEDTGVEDEVVEQLSVMEALDRLKPEEREIVDMKVLSDMTFKEISEILQIPRGTVTWRYQAAIKKSRRYGYE